MSYFNTEPLRSPYEIVQFSHSVVSDSEWTDSPWTAARQASLSITSSWSLLKLMSIESVMPSNHLILYCTPVLLPSIFPSIRGFRGILITLSHSFIGNISWTNTSSAQCWHMQAQKNNIWDSCCWLPIVMVINCAFIKRIGVGIYSLLRLFSDSQIIWVHPTHQHGRRPGDSLGQSFLLTTIMVAKNTVASFGNQSPKSIINE